MQKTRWNRMHISLNISWVNVRDTSESDAYRSPSKWTWYRIPPKRYFKKEETRFLGRLKRIYWGTGSEKTTPPEPTAFEVVDPKHTNKRRETISTYRGTVKTLRMKLDAVQDSCRTYSKFLHFTASSAHVQVAMGKLIAILANIFQALRECL